jgi:uncharacterized protein YdhG (YjbR/CyaY superfamily)
MPGKSNAPAKTVDEYLNALPGDLRIVLEELRRAIRKAAPKAEEVISYQVPTYKYNGPLLHFAAFTDHCSLIIINKSIIKTFEKELKNFKTTGTTIHFTADKPLPSTLVKKIVKMRIKDNEERQLARKGVTK